MLYLSGMEIQQLQEKFAMINVRMFAERYQLSYDHLWRVLKGKRELTDRYAQEITAALEKFKNSL